jgi:hypothetical protein
MEALMDRLFEEGRDGMGAGLPALLRNPVDLPAYRPLNPAGCRDRRAGVVLFLYTIRIFIHPIRSRGIGDMISLGRGCAIAM